MHNRKEWNVRSFKRLLIDNGFQYNRSKGDHDIYKRGSSTISIPATGINAMLAQRLIKENCLEV